MKKAWLWMTAAVAGVLALEGAARLLARPWPTLGDFALRLETLSDEFLQDDLPGVLLVGDSIVYGNDVAYAETYPALLQRMWEDAHSTEPLAFINGGVSGLTTLYGAMLLPLLLRRFQPRVVVVSFGLNDGNFARSCLDSRLEAEFMVPRAVRLLRGSRLFTGLERRWRRWNSDCGSWEGKLWEPRVSEEAFVRALLAMVRQVKRHRAALIFLTTTPVAPGFRPELDAVSREQLRQSCARYNALIRQVARQTGAGLVDVYANLQLASGDWREDGVHLTSSGYRTLAGFLVLHLEPRKKTNMSELP
jgi:lysophospholipase L1-like esterase